MSNDIAAERGDAREPTRDRVRIGEMLADAGLLTAEQLRFALRVQQKLRYHERLGGVIEALGLVGAEELHQAIHAHRRSLGIPEILLDLGLLSAADLDAGERIQKLDPERNLEAVLLEERFIDEDALLKALSEKFDLPSFVPRMEEIDETLLRDKSLVELKARRLLPLRRGENGAVRVAISDPRDTRTRAVIDALFGSEIELLLATPTQIAEALASVEVAHRAARDEGADHDRIGELLDEIIAAAHRDGASDVHIEPLPSSVRVRIRVDGLLVQLREFPKIVHTPLVSRIKVLSDADIAERRRHQDGHMIVDCDGYQLDVRTSFYVSIHGETAVLRILSRRQGVTPLAELGFAPLAFRRYVEDVIEPETGIVILTGPTGSGKTTTLSASISALNRIDNKIITAEDPVEYQIDGVTQCQINNQIGRTFEETLRAIVRQDPDIIVLGEMRDAFSANVAVQAALTGHKVFTTFHTEDSVGALLRLINMDVKPYFIASTVRGVVAQRLLRRTCQRCQQPYSPSQEEIRLCGLSARDARSFRFVRGAGCDGCSFSGFRGRIGVFEVLTPTDAVKDQLISQPTASSVRNAALESAGLVTLREDGLAKAALGLTTLDEVSRHTPRNDHRRDLDTILDRVGRT